DVRTLMIGVRNNGTTVRSVEIWANEMRLKGFNDDGGWAAQSTAQLALSDLGNINFSGRYESDGFGGIEQRVSERRMDNYGAVNLAMSFNLGRLVPKENLLNLPLYYSISKQVNTPKYDPLNEDLLLSEVLAQAEDKAQRDSIKNYSQTLKDYRSFSLNNVKLNVKSKTPLPIDPANFSFNYSFNESFERDATTEYEITRNYQAGMSYGYSSPVKAFEPFAKSKAEWLKSPWLKTIKDFSLTYIPNSVAFSTNLNRYYYELQNRDLSSLSSEVANMIPLTFSKNFMWNTDFNLNWNLTRNMKFNFTTNNSARVEETLNTPVNKELSPTEYQNWKDTVMTSLMALGTPMAYQQNMKYTCQIPFKNIPVLDFVTASFQYSSNYKWDRSAMIADVDMGNVIANQRSISFNPSLNLETLYNKSDYLKAVNRKFASNARSSQSKKPETFASKKKKAKNKESKLTLLPDTQTEFKHNLKNKRVEVHFVDAKGKEVDVKYKVLDENTLRIKSKDSLEVKIVVTPKPSLEEENWYKALQLTSRLLMSVRNIQVTYQENDNFNLPGFKPESGLFFGTENYQHAPGWHFASGLYNADEFLNSSIQKNWLVMSDSVVSPAVMTKTKSLKIKSSVQPIPGLKIDLSAQRNENDNRQVQYMIDGRPQTRAGSFSMSTVALRTALAPINAKKSYASKAFDEFVANREIIAARLESQYRQLQYPDQGFLSGSDYAGQAYDASNGGVNKNSADVLVPAFLAAYTGKSAHHSALDIFPSLLSLMPNWSVTYDGLSKLPAFKAHFKSFSLNHAYNCSYNVSSFGSYNTFVSAGQGDLGFVQDVLSGNPIPSAQFDIAGVSITESFSPLIGAKATLKNGMTLKAEVQTGRTLNLSVTGGQLVESGRQQYVLGASYKMVDFHPWGILADSKVKNDFSITADFSLKNSTALLRKIEEQYTQATSGNKTCTMEIMGDYVISKNLNFKIFYDLESSIPLVSSYPVTTQNFGVSLRFTLSR
ncbi:MAG: cell surface protein SprA, partial [Bacteroidales bacterium]|nr:cell surface protein SprA [Bacteroidales bacterium]